MILTFYDENSTSPFSADCRDPCATEELDGSRKTMTFAMDGRLYDSIKTEMTFTCDGTRYKIKDISPDDEGYAVSVESVIDMAELEGIWVRSFAPPALSGHEGIDYGQGYNSMFDPSNIQPARCAQDVVAGMYAAGILPSGWTVRFLPAPLPPGTEPPQDYGVLWLNGVYEADGITAAEAIAKLAGMVYGFGGAYSIDNISETITIGAVGYGDKDYGHSTPFIYGHNLRRLVRTESSRGLVTRLYAYGKEGLDLTSVCGGREYVEDFSYTSRTISAIWINTDISDANVLKQAAEERLTILSRPTKTYSADIIDLSGTRDDADSLRYKIGEYGRFQDSAINADERMRIVKTVRYLDEPEKNSVELSSPIPTIEDFEEKVRMLTANWEKITNPDGSINGVYVHGVKAGDVVGIETVITQSGAVRDAVVSVIHDVIGN